MKKSFLLSQTLAMTLLMSACSLNSPTSTVDVSQKDTIHNSYAFLNGNITDNTDDTSSDDTNDDNNTVHDPDNTSSDDSDIDTVYNLPDVSKYLYGTDMKIHSKDEIITASTAYFDHLESIDSEEASIRYTFVFVNNDNLPELAYSIGDYHSSSVQLYTYDFDSDCLVNLGSFGEYGCMGYFEYTNIVESFYMGMGTILDEYITFNDDYSLNYLLSLEYDDMADTQTYYINGVQAPDFAYEMVMETWNDLLAERSHPINYSDMVPYSDDYSELFYTYDVSIDFDEDHLLDLFTKYIEESGKCFYDFVYLNYDNCPELILTDGTEHSASCEVVVFDIYNDCLTSLGTFGSYGTFEYFEKTGIFASESEGMGYFNQTFYYLNNVLELIKLQSFSNNYQTLDNGDNIYFNVDNLDVPMDIYNDLYDKWYYSFDDEYQILNAEDMNNIFPEDYQDGIAERFNLVLSQY